MKFSVIVPAHNEEALIGGCLDSVRLAAEPYPGDVEIIVVLNRCDDRTEEIARAAGAVIVREDAKNLSMIRNAGARQASGDIIVTIDADSRMSENMLQAVDKVLASRKYIGGGVRTFPERWSPGLFCTFVFLYVTLFFMRLAGGSYWCYRRDFEAVGGFPEQYHVAEDLAFAKRLSIYGKKRGKRFINLPGARLTTSCRKFDHYGDWYFFKILLNPKPFAKSMKGEDTTFSDEFFYEFKRPARTEKEKQD